MNRIARFVARISQPTPPDSVQDWPRDLRINAAAAKLAPAFYDAHYEVTHGTLPGPWKALHPAIRHAWVKRAEFALRMVL